MNPFQIADRLVDDILAISPMACTSVGVPGSDDCWDDLSPDGLSRINDLARSYRSEIGPHLDHPEEDQRHAARVMAGFLDTQIDEYESGDYQYDLNHMACGFSRVRDIFDIMARDSATAWSNIAARLRTIGEPLSGWRRVLAEGIGQGRVVARRQVESVIEQAENLAGPESRFLDLLDEARAADLLTSELEEAAGVARREAAELARWLEEGYLPHGAHEDGVGEERYLRAAERFLGLTIDPAETYRWGWDEIARIRAEMTTEARLVDSDRGVAEVIELLENDPGHTVSRPEFCDFIQARLDQAVADLAGAHFRVPDPIQRITVNTAPPGGALGAWYINPSADWERPGSVWYSLGDKTRIPIWQEVSTAYHEGFPGHHLQVGTAMYQSERLSRVHRLFVWYPGYGEGWALYAERLMDELGYFERPEYRLGMLASQLFRAVRVVVDLGFHLGFPIPQSAPLHAGEKWNYDRAVDYVAQIGLQPKDVSESEVKRYLGWAGQAISYKVGEREILDIRNTRQQRPDFELKSFHRHLLEGGELRLDHLRERMLTL